MFYFRCSGNTTLVNQFNNCQVIFSNINNNSFLFEGYTEDNNYDFYEVIPSFFKFYFIDNCISSFDIIYKADKLYFNDELGENNLTFESSFQYICDHPIYCVPVEFDNIPTYEFTHSIEFSNSKEFIDSSFFTQSLVFTHSQFFSDSSPFTESSFFTNSRFFTESNVFSKTNILMGTNAFNESQYFSDISKLTSDLISKLDSDTNEIALDSEFEKFSLSELFADYLFSSSSNDLSIIPKKGGISKGAIIGAVIGLVGAILIIITVTILAIKKRKIKDDNSIKEDQSKQATFYRQLIEC